MKGGARWEPLPSFLAFGAEAEEQKLDREAREQIAKDIISEIVKTTLGELYEMSENSKEEE